MHCNKFTFELRFLISIVLRMITISIVVASFMCRFVCVISRASAVLWRCKAAPL